MKKVANLKINSVIYDKELDILELYNGSKTDHCVKLDDLIILHCNKNNKVVGVEFLGISKIYNINQRLLNSLKSAEITVNTISGKTFVTINLTSFFENKETTTKVLSPPIESQSVCA